MKVKVGVCISILENQIEMNMFAGFWGGNHGTCILKKVDFLKRLFYSKL